MCTPPITRRRPATSGCTSKPWPTFHRGRFVGDRRRRLLQRLGEQPGAEHLRRLREPELPAIERGGDAQHARFVLARLLHGVGDRQRQQSADRVALAFAHQVLHVAQAEAGPRRVVHQQPVVRVHAAARRHDRVIDRIAPARAAAIERLHPAGERAPVLPREALVVRREHHEHGLHAGHANCSNRVPEHGPAGERAILLRLRARDARAAAGGRNQSEDRQRKFF
jgi:hypothetical protein